MTKFKSLWGSLTIIAFLAAAPVGATDPDPKYDRLDGSGRSGKKVNVIEWEGSLEIHVYPAGSLKGLALKLDKKNKDKPVMVIGYRFTNNPEEQLIRRAILGIPMQEGFHAYRDTSSGSEYDKVVITNQVLQMAKFSLEPGPSQLYPEGHPALANSNGDPEGGSPKRPATTSRVPATNSEHLEKQEDGTIRSFSW